MHGHMYHLLQYINLSFKTRTGNAIIKLINSYDSNVKPSTWSHLLVLIVFHNTNKFLKNFPEILISLY